MFRAWDKRNAAWIYSNHLESGMAWFWDIVNTYDCDVMQFTGLQDKNGKDIYEGDILCFTGMDKIHRKPFIISWDKEYAEFSKYFPKKEAEVIGNIYENLSLLEDKK
jgi:hypothetical protein